GFPKSLSPRSILVYCSETMKSRTLLIFASDAPLWIGKASTIQLRDGEDRVLTYHVRKRTDEQWSGRVQRKENDVSVVVPVTESEFDSTIEEAFWARWQRTSTIRLIPQHPVLGYRIDFAHLPTRIAIELDGYYYHADAERFRKDRQRDRALAQQ